MQSIEQPSDIKDLSIKQLKLLAQEVREEILSTISDLGGHLASSLGAVELNLALHYVFDAPRDHLVWDMGYQAFTHKLITGRRDRFRTLKQYKGLSGFCHKDESPYDLFISGHGGTVLSTALGLAMAEKQSKKKRNVAAIIGDASLGEGMALEALNHIGHVKPNLLVVLNDNKMSIAKPIGGLSRYLNRMITNPIYNRLRNDMEQLVGKLPHGSKLVKLGHKVQESVKGFLMPGLVFEELGLRYVGPIDGHNIQELITTIKNVKRMKGPILLHVLTTKGKGYTHAENDPERFHKFEAFELASGQAKAKKQKNVSTITETFTDAFSEELVRQGEADKKLHVITAAMPEGTGVHLFAKRYPDRFIDVGMAEQHAVGLAAGLTKGGSRAIVAIYSTFMQRAYDQIMHEVCLQELPVILCLDRASLVGEDGPTHHGVFDIAYLRVLPNILVASPKDPAEMRAMLVWAMEQRGPVALRYSRGGVLCGEPSGKSSKVITGKGECLREGKDIAIIAIGSMVYPALEIAKRLEQNGVEAAVYNARFIKPIDQEMVRAAASTGSIVTLEEAQVAGGFGSAVSETLDALNISATPQLRIGLPDQFIEHGDKSDLHKLCGIDLDSMYERISNWRASNLEASSSAELPFATSSTQ